MSLLFCFVLIFQSEKEATAVQGFMVLWQLSEMNDARLTFMTAFPQRLQCCKAACWSTTIGSVLNGIRFIVAVVEVVIATTTSDQY